MANLPQYSYFAGEWREYPERIYPASSIRYPAALINVDIGHASWQDLFLKDYFEYLRENPLAGVYFDCVNIYSKSETDGRFRYKVFPVRDFLQRIYIVQREANPRSWSISHCGAAVTDFCNIFAEIALTGEHYRADLQKHRYYLEFQSLEEFRVQNCGKSAPGGCSCRSSAMSPNQSGGYCRSYDGNGIGPINCFTRPPSAGISSIIAATAITHFTMRQG